MARGYQTRTSDQSLPGETSATGWSRAARPLAAPDAQLAWSTRISRADTTRDTLARIQGDYAPDIMIFDLPSILIGDDARAFLQHVDCALIVARAEQTRYGDFDSCEREVGEYTNVLGVVLNGYRHGEGKVDAETHS